MPDSKSRSAEIRSTLAHPVIDWYGGMNPRFFEGTRVADYARKLLAA